jgi:hypothetical protein
VNDEHNGDRAAARLPDEPEVRHALDRSARDGVVDIVSAHPSSPLAWTELADQADSEARSIESYAYATVAVELACNLMKDADWSPGDPVSWSEESNRPYLRALDAKRRAASHLGLDEEVRRATAELTSADEGAAARIASEFTPTQLIPVISIEQADATAASSGETTAAPGTAAAVALDESAAVDAASESGIWPGHGDPLAEEAFAAQRDAVAEAGGADGDPVPTAEAGAEPERPVPDPDRDTD